MEQIRKKNKANRNILYVIPELDDCYPNDVDDAEEVDVIHPPLGILYIASYCEKYGNYSPVIVDAMVKGQDMTQEVMKLIKQKEVDIVCITSMTANFYKATNYAQAAKSLGCITIIGGVHVSSAYKDVLHKECYDFGIVGEGEAVMLELLNALCSNHAYNDIKGIAYQQNGKVVFTGKQDRIVNLDVIPFPAYDKIDMDKYLAVQSLGIITSRGCPNDCLFCASKCLWNRRVTYRSTPNVVDEIEMLCRKYDYYGKEINIYDDNFILQHNRVRELCNAMIEHRFDLRWKCMSRVDTINEQIMEDMRRAGCYKISFGIESVSEKTLGRINKNIDLAQIEKAIKMCNDAGITFLGYFMIGFPWENKENFMETLSFIKDHPEIETSLSVLSPYPGTEFYEKREKWGIEISETWDKFNHLSTVIKSRNYSEADIAYAYSYYLLMQEKRYRNMTNS